MLQQMSFDMDVATDNGMTGNLAKGLSIYEEYGAYENAQAVRENLNAGTPIDYMAFKALRPDLAITPERENYEENRKEREKNESPWDY
ncbi:hypothetical protein, partial [Propionispira raffinosivorans]|uniref:hypothetical protein n=1 Tax=Propionispira raffinosivorans TaxID=86959 RepID=UPI0004763288